MKIRCFSIIALAVLAVIFAGAAYAATVTVTPVDMQGWTTATNYADTYATIKNVAPAGCPAGDGAAYGATGMHGGDGTSPIGQSWIGTNAYANTPISQITKLEYWTYAFQQGVDGTHFTRQPFELFLLTIKSPTNTSQRPLLFRPWGILSNEELDNPWGQWLRVDAIAGVVYDANGNPVYTATTPCWVDLNVPDPGNTYTPKTWAYLVAKYPTAIITTPATGWNVLGQAPTGAGVNFFAGGIGTSSNWYLNAWRDMFNFAGYVDNFTIGINGVNTTYDFEGPVPVGTYAISNTTAKSVAMQNAKQWHRFVICGKVTLQIDADNFLVDDGSGTIVQVHAVGYDALSCDIGNYIRAVGSIDNLTTPATLNSSAANIQSLHEIIHF